MVLTAIIALLSGGMEARTGLARNWVTTDDYPAHAVAAGQMERFFLRGRDGVPQRYVMSRRIALAVER